MKKDCFIKLYGKETTDQCFETELTTVGSYVKKRGKHIITYEEISYDCDEKIVTTIEVGDNDMCLTRVGKSNSYLSFVQGEKRIAYYDTPIGAFSIGITTKEMAVEMAETDGIIELEYYMDINNVHMSQREMRVDLSFV